MYQVVLFLLRMLSLLPMKIHYFFSDVLYFPLFYLIRYRRKIVRKNLAASFPEKDLSQIKHIERCFYHNLCDYFVETLKMATISRDHISRRMRFEGIDSIEHFSAQGKPCVVYLAHTFNWEWITSLPLHFKDKELVFGQIYHPLESKLFDRLFLSLRGRFGAVSIPMANTLRRIVEYKNENKTFIIGFLADQVPNWEAINHWIDFLHHDTPVLTGTEKIATRTGAAVFYGVMRREKRGSYVCDFQLIAEDASLLPDYELTDRYFEILSRNIAASPSLWLWTHNRWKRTRKGYFEREKRREEARRQLAAENKNEEACHV